MDFSKAEHFAFETIMEVAFYGETPELMYNPKTRGFYKRGLKVILATGYVTIDNLETRIEGRFITYTLRPALKTMWFRSIKHSDIHTFMETRLKKCILEFRDVKLSSKKLGIIFPWLKKHT